MLVPAEVFTVARAEEGSAVLIHNAHRFVQSFPLNRRHFRKLAGILVERQAFISFGNTRVAGGMQMGVKAAPSGHRPA